MSRTGFEDEGGIDVTFWSENENEIEGMFADFVKIAESDDWRVKGRDFCGVYFSALSRLADDDLCVKRACAFEVSADDMSKRVQETENGWTFGMTIKDTDERVPVLFGAIAKRYYPSVEVRYASWIYDDEIDDLEYCRNDPDGEYTQGKKYHAVFCDNINEDGEEDDIGLCWVHREDWNVDSPEEAEEDRQRCGYGKVFVTEWKDVKVEDEYFCFGKKLKDINLKDLDAEIKAHENQGPTK